MESYKLLVRKYQKAVGECMDYDKFELVFENDEKQFIYGEGVNKGHSLSYSKINRCLFLSLGAKQLYTNISEYAYNGKRNCFPSQISLMVQLGLSRNSIQKYTDELKNFGLIKITRTGGGNYVYHLQELHLVKALVHSEVVYNALDLFKSKGEEVIKALDEYKQSDLCKNANEEPSFFQRNIYDFFRHYFERPSQEKYYEEVWGSVEVVKEKAKKDEPHKPKRFINTSVPTQEIKKETNPDSPERVKTKRTKAIDTPVEEWNTNHFVEHFEQKYLQVMKLPCLGAGIKERGQLKRLVDVYSEHKNVLKEKMDIYVQSDFFSPKGISNFCSNYVQGLLDQYIKTGSFERKTESTLVPKEDSGQFDDLMKRNNERLLK